MFKKVQRLFIFRNRKLGFAGFVDYAGEFFDNCLAVQMSGIFDVDKGETSGFEETLHIFRGGAGSGVVLGLIFEFDDADWTESALVAKDEINSFAADELISFFAVLAADFMGKQSREFNIGNDIEFLTKDFV